MKELRQDALKASTSDLMFENHHNWKGRGLYLVNNSLYCFSRMLALHDHHNRREEVLRCILIIGISGKLDLILSRVGGSAIIFDEQAVDGRLASYSVEEFRVGACEDAFTTEHIRVPADRFTRTAPEQNLISASSPTSLGDLPDASIHAVGMKHLSFEIAGAALDPADRLVHLRDPLPRLLLGGWTEIVRRRQAVSRCQVTQASLGQSVSLLLLPGDVGRPGGETCDLHIGQWLELAQHQPRISAL